MFNVLKKVLPILLCIPVGSGMVGYGQSVDGQSIVDDIQSAINALPPSGGVIVVKGSHTISDAIRITKGDITLLGTDNATIWAADNYCGFYYDVYTMVAIQGTVTDPVRNVRISNIRFDGNGDNAHPDLGTYDTIRIRYAENITISGCSFYDTYLMGVDVSSDGDRVEIVDCTFDGGVDAPTGAYIYTCTEGTVSVHECSFSNISNQAFYVDTGQVVADRCEFSSVAVCFDVRCGGDKSRISNSHARGGSGFFCITSVGADYVSIAGCTVKETSSSGVIRLQGSYGTVRGCEIVGSALADKGVIDIRGTNNIIEKNYVSGSLLGQSYLVAFRNLYGSTAGGNEVRDNTFVHAVNVFLVHDLTEHNYVYMNSYSDFVNYVVDYNGWMVTTSSYIVGAPTGAPTPARNEAPQAPCDYDAPQFGGDGNGIIAKNEAAFAILDYFRKAIDKPLAVRVILYYLQGSSCNG